MSFLNERKILTREKRLSTLSHFNGTVSTLNDENQGAEIKQKIRTLSQVSYDEILYAISVLSKIEQAAVVVHGAVGCAASCIYYNERTPFTWYSTNLNERDTILGGDEKLRKAILRAYEEECPKVIFIVGTPVVAINNDDIHSIMLELEDELGIKLIFIYTDGFKTKAPTTGFDIAAHSLLRHVVKHENIHAREKENFINVISFSEGIENLAATLKILNELQIPFHLLPQYASIDTIGQAGKARATVVLSEEEGAYFAEELEEVFDVPYVRAKAPVGLRATRKFIMKLAKQLNIEEKALQYIKQHEEELQPVLKERILEGKTVFLDQSLEIVLGLSDVVEELGGTVGGIAIPYLDLNNRVNIFKMRDLKAATPIVIANGQAFEKANILSKKQMDYYIGGPTNVAFSMVEGSIPISANKFPIYGYVGMKKLIHQLKRASAYPSDKTRSIYKKSWLRKSSNWYVKQEVR